MKTLLVVAPALALALLACGKKAEKPAGGSAGSAVAANKPPIDAGATATVDAKGAPAKPTKISKATRAEYKKRLQAGRTLAKATKWPEALVELEAALAAIPGDDRALAELSYAYMASGDHDKARKAGRAAVLAATEPKIKAAALYNLGRVEESAAPTKAAALYKESLALRPNKTVEKRLADLATKVPSTPEPSACATPMPEAALCDCLRKGVVDNFEPGADIACTLEPTAVKGFQLARYAQSEMNEESISIVAQGPTGWAVVGELAYVYNPGMFGISEDWTLDLVREEPLGDRSIVRFESTKTRQDSDMGLDEMEEEESKELVVCVRDPKGGLPTCPLDVTHSHTYVRDRIGLAEPGDLDDVTELQTPGLPIKSETKIEVTLGADGVAKLRVMRGRVEGDVGDKRLW